MADVDTHNNERSDKRKEFCTSTPSVDLTRDMDAMKFQEILIAGAATPLDQLSRDVEYLANMNSKITIQRLIWTPVAKWHDLKKLSKYNAGLRVAFSKDNASLLCNFVIKTRYPEQAKYLGLDLSAPFTTKWLTPTGPQVVSLRNSEHKWWSLVTREIGLGGSEHLYDPAISFMEPGPALLYGLETGIVMIMKDVATGLVAGAVREDVVMACLTELTKPWYAKPKSYGRFIIPRSESGAITWYYDQDSSSREGAVERLEEILGRAKDREFLNFEGKDFR
ncbi:hypothetical protein DL98DRAFT_537734 [Cadophora sp. DSE1049]|nr:hypothetical protein DL98DRAFT_537734 [Cadophora sp. DSE1049]